jgi:hypothetical protein
MKVRFLQPSRIYNTSAMFRLRPKFSVRSKPLKDGFQHDPGVKAYIPDVRFGVVSCC